MKKSLILLAFTCFSLFTYSQELTISSGKVKRYIKFKSKFIASRNVDIWLPDGYSKKQKYAVLYMNDGQMLFDSTVNLNRKEWQVDETLGKLLKASKIKNCIVVAIWNTEKRAAEYLPYKPFITMSKASQEALKKQHNSDIISDNYLKFVVEEVKPFIDKTFNVYKNKENTFIIGSSMGALIALYALCEYPSVFGGAACISTHWMGATLVNNTEFREAFKTYLNTKLPLLKYHKIYFDYGTVALDSYYEQHQKVIDSLMFSNGFTSQNWVTKKFEGDDHSEKSWSKRLYIPLVFLIGK